jgi:predicted nucleotidyltransferase
MTASMAHLERYRRTPRARSGIDRNCARAASLGHIQLSPAAAPSALDQESAESSPSARLCGTTPLTSDVDLMVVPESGEKPGAFGLSRLVAEAQDLFGRDVDIIVGAPRDRGLSQAIEREGVVLHDTR